MTFKEIMADTKAKRWACLSWSASLLLLVYFFYAEKDLLLFTPLIYSLLLAVLPFTNKNHTHQLFPEYFDDPLSQLRLEGEMLHVKQHQLTLANVNKVAIDQLDDTKAFIDFPYTMYGKLKFSFPAKELPAVKAFFQQHCPDIQIIS
ncbi:MAG: hypothetical protein KJ556_19990 [Gammaproteobacteria bacterium]|nr:hypothetical protein [Gammaproteobacteria bacterium]MBU2058652.1 hypothetical protein [Gammaproteobacteria bacterium]MBU2177382.1 hypothetical protein [Gammaproteobacteria bacterium]MBU2246397.1 hypothetical protein [Gammaproteobacteria bacterium]MBU2344542.1 hypothetical protein [Gammaproteobacteria bacterium]